MSLRDKTIRSLVALNKTGSTSRVLNLRSCHKNTADSEVLLGAPFFENHILNTSIVLKHRIRRDEYDIFEDSRQLATKVIMPLDQNNLRVGAHFVMVGQKHFEEQTASSLGDALKSGSRDRKVLDLLDGLPSLDPFLVREQLRRHGYEPARAYFNISDADVLNMRAFVEAEVGSLADQSMDGGQGSHTSRLVNKLLTNSVDLDLGPLRDVLRMTEAEYLDGIFAWRGFLYFKWVNAKVAPAVERLKAAISAVRPNMMPDDSVRRYLAGARVRLCEALDEASETIRDLLAEYDDAYKALVEQHNPGAFRQFLLDAPDKFMSIGQPLGAQEHMLSFWRYRFPNTRAPSISPDELWDLFADFENNIGTRAEEAVLVGV